MELYNKEFVYFDWDDKLEGKKGFFSDDINTLKQAVKDNRTGLFGEIIKNTESDSQFPFGFIDDSGSSHCFRFCYYDPYYEFRRVYLEGKQLQFKSNSGEWEDIPDGFPPLFTTDEYRIKPKPESVPFDTVQELIDGWKKKSGIEFNRELLMPLIWIKNKDTNKVYLITEFLYDCYDVGTSSENLTLLELFNDFTFLDGSIIGKIKE